MFVSVLVVRGVLAEFQKRGVDGPAWLRENGVDQAMLTDTRASVDVDTWNRLLHRAMATLDDPGLGLTIGFGDSEGMLQLLGYMLLSSRTLQEAFELCQRYSALIVDDLRLELVHVGQRSHFRFGFHNALSAEAARFGEEFVAALAFRIGRHHIPDGPPPELRFRQPTPAYRARFDAFFMGVPCRFGCDHSEIVFDRQLLLQSQPHGDGQVIESLSGTADRLLREIQTVPALAERVRLLLDHEPDLGTIDAEQIALKMGLNSRTLRRRLRDEGANLRTLIDECRMRAACVILSNPSTTIKDTAERLGYSEPSAFHRAFKRWTGQTPAEYCARIEVVRLEHQVPALLSQDP
ncbi:MAG: AraC family transcriptional regulator [Myxococcales bacterium]